MNTKETVLRELVNFAVDYVAQNQLTVTEDDLLRTIGVTYTKAFDNTDNYLLEEAIRKAEEVKGQVAEALNKLYTEEWESEFKRATDKDDKKEDDDDDDKKDDKKSDKKKGKGKWVPPWAEEKEEMKKSDGVGHAVVSEAERNQMKTDLTDHVKDSDKNDSEVAAKAGKRDSHPLTVAEITKIAHENPNSTKDQRVHKSMVVDILTNHPLHRLAHDMDDDDTGFDWSRVVKSIDVDFVPREVIDEINRRHGPNYYPHVHADDSIMKDSGQFYGKSAGNSLYQEFNELHETLHRTDHYAYRRSEQGLSQIYSSLEGGGGFNYLGHELSGEFQDHIAKHHGTSWDQHALFVPVVKAYDSNMTIEDAARGGGWDVYPFPKADYGQIKSNVHTGANFVAGAADAATMAKMIPHPVAQTVGAVGSVVSPIAHAVADATKPGSNQTGPKPNEITNPGGANPSPLKLPVPGPNPMPDTGGAGIALPNPDRKYIPVQKAGVIDATEANSDDKQAPLPKEAIMMLLQKAGGDPQKAAQMLSELSQGQITPEQALSIIQQVAQAGPADSQGAPPPEQGGGIPPENDANAQPQETGEDPVPPSSVDPSKQGFKKGLQVQEFMPGFQIVKNVRNIETQQGFEDIVKEWYRA